jgi:predicted P-loop ATPase/GTPase
LLDALAVHPLRERRIDNIEVDAAKGEVAGRPAEPATDLERAAAAKCSRYIIEKHGLIAVDEAHQWFSPIGVPIVRHLAPQIAPGMAELVASSDVRKATVGADDLEPGRDIISFRQGVCGREKLRVRARHYLSLIAEKSGT